jgi:methionine--tRNA ligase beta chain
MKEQIEYLDFIDIEKKLEVMVGQVVSATRVPKSDKLIQLSVIFGVNEEDEKVVVTNLGQTFEPEEFLGVTFPFVMNLKPSKMMGITSEAMIMPLTKSDGSVRMEPFGSIGDSLL